MIGLLQRVQNASVLVDGSLVSEIGRGILVFIGVERGDGRAEAERLLLKLLGYRVFPDQDGKMNRSLADINGGLLLVPQFTLASDTKKWMRPGFSTAASPDSCRSLFAELVNLARQRYSSVDSGIFGEDMQVSLTNDGPVTFWLQVSPRKLK